MSRYATENIVFFDFETRCKVPIKLGSYRYAIEADATILTWAQGLGPVQIIEKGGKALSWNDFPADLQAAFHNPNKTFCAYNAGFDRCVWNYSLLDSPWMAPGKVIDANAIGERCIAREKNAEKKIQRHWHALSLSDRGSVFKNECARLPLFTTQSQE